MTHISDPARIDFTTLCEHIDPTPYIDDGLNVDIPVVVVVAQGIETAAPANWSLLRSVDE